MLAALAVVVLAVLAVQVVSGRLSREVAPAVLEVPKAVEWIADHLPDEVTAQLSHADVTRIVGWHLEWFSQVGLSSDWGEELGAVAFPAEVEVEVDTDAAVDFVVAEALAARPDLDAVHVAVVLDRHLAYLREIGAITDL